MQVAVVAFLAGRLPLICIERLSASRGSAANNRHDGEDEQSIATCRAAPAVTHTEAAVVRPCKTSRRMKMTPPPTNPAPDTTWAATRDGSKTTR